ncbi:MAG: HAD family hydrolase [Rectinema subterraneum]|uniref:HAD family hydrolase n=1 Tax=Rectinema subterraneum TaxID=2653714 RepID=UPI003C7C62C9
MHFDYIWFDMGYTLVYKKREALFGRILEKTGSRRSYEEIEKAFHVTDKRLMRDFPGLLARPSAEFMPLYIGLLCYTLQIHGDIVSILDAWFKEWKSKESEWFAYSHVFEVLDALLKKGYRLGIISNWDLSARSVLAKCGLEGYFDTIVISSEVGYAKPDRRIFISALQLAGVEPSNCLYIGDNYYDDVVGASSVGMKYLIINRFGRLGIEELPQLEVVSSIADVIPYLERTDREQPQHRNEYSAEG